MRLKPPLAALTLIAGLLAAAPAQAAEQAESKRVVVYYQTQYHDNSYVSPKALTDNSTGVTDLLVGALHLNGDGSVHLNDHPPGDSRYNQMWTDLAAMQAKGVHVLLMVGGAAQGTFQRLDTEFSTYYPRLKSVISTYGLDGVDLDVEENMSLAGVERLIDQLKADFGDDFLITLAPVAPALRGGGNLSGFDYDELYADRGADIAWFNAQFYCGWGSLSSTTDYDRIIQHGVVPASKVVAGVLTNSSLCGGYVPLATVKSTLAALVAKYPDFGGVDGWEYFISDPDGTAAPWKWAKEVSGAMNGSAGPANLALNKAATGSAACATSEGPAKAVNGSVGGGNSDKFCTLAASKWLRVDLGASHPIGRFEVAHASAGGESASYNTKAFRIQTSADGSAWTTRVTVTDNTAGTTSHPVSGISARYLRLNVTTPTQGSDPAARIYEFRAFS